MFASFFEVSHVKKKKKLNKHICVFHLKINLSEDGQVPEEGGACPVAVVTESMIADTPKCF